MVQRLEFERKTVTRFKLSTESASGVICEYCVSNHHSISMLAAICTTDVVTWTTMTIVLTTADD